MITRPIFIASRPGFFARMQLRSPLFNALRDTGSKLCVLWPALVDLCLQDELGDDISFLPLYTQRSAREINLTIERILLSLRSFAAPRQNSFTSPQTWRLHRLNHAAQLGTWRQKVYQKSLSLGVTLLSSSSLARVAIMRFEEYVTRTNFYGNMFETYRPGAVVVATGGFASWAEDGYLIREAQRDQIPVIYVVMSWDNPSTKGLMSAIPDYFLVWTDEMKQEFVKLHDIDPTRIYVTGTPMVDAYINAQEHNHRAELISQYGLDPQRCTILIGTMSPSTYPYNVDIVEVLCRALLQDQFAKPSQIIIRPHPLNYKHGKTHTDVVRMRELARQSPHIHISEPKIVSNDQMDLPWSETDEMIRLVSGADVMVNMFSTMQLEAALVDTPIINVAFDPGDLQPYDHSLTEIPFYPHIARIILTGGVQLANSERELIERVNAYIINPKMDQDGRRAIVQQECGPIDGLSSQRIAQLIVQLAAKGVNT